ncbi:MAG: adenylate/guanylate cyclase domain-containing protein [Thermodesulfobacteriota bacterium]
MRNIDFDTEQLREKLLEQEEISQSYKKKYSEAEYLLSVLMTLNLSSNVEEMFSNLIQKLQKVLEFENAFILTEQEGFDKYLAEFSSEPMFNGSTWSSGTLSKMVLKGKGRTAISTNTSEITEWKTQSNEFLSNAVSALYIPLIGRKKRAILVCVHSQEAFFQPRHKDIASRLIQLATQAILKAEDLEELNDAFEQSQRDKKEIAEKKEQIEALAGKLSKYVARQIFDSILLGEKDVKIESYRKKLTIFFSDIRGFTEVTDSMEPEALASLLNNYLNEMSDIALRYGGTIDKFIGDSIMIFFGDPHTKGEEEDALACVLMAIAMRERMKSLRRKWEDKGILKPLSIRMGINTGYCTVGNFGSEDRLDYTIIGGQVNLTSRLEYSAEPDQILISHETYALVKNNIFCEKREEIKVKGIANPVQTYQVIDLHERISKETKLVEDKKEGFLLSVDLNKIDKTHAISLLKEAIKKIE